LYNLFPTDLAAFVLLFEPAHERLEVFHHRGASTRHVLTGFLFVFASVDKRIDLIYRPNSKQQCGVAPYSQHFFAGTPITLESSDSTIKHASGWLAVTAASGHPFRPWMNCLLSLSSNLAEPPRSFSKPSAALIRSRRLHPFNRSRWSAATAAPTSCIVARNVRGVSRFEMTVTKWFSNGP